MHMIYLYKWLTREKHVIKYVYIFGETFTFLSKWHLDIILSRSNQYGCGDSEVVTGILAKRRNFGDNKTRFWIRPNALLVAQYKLKHCKKKHLELLLFTI